jgi:hypothetical protein
MAAMPVKAKSARHADRDAGCFIADPSRPPSHRIGEGDGNSNWRCVPTR